MNTVGLTTALDHGCAGARAPRTRGALPRMLVMAAATLLIGAGSAYASVVTVNVSGSYSTAWSNTTGNVASVTNENNSGYLGNPFSENLGLLNPVTTNLFTLAPAGSSGLGGTHPTASGTLTLTFSFTDPNGATGDLTDTGTYQAKYGGSPLGCSTSGYGDTDCIDWSSSNNPITVDFSDGDVLQMTLVNASDWDITPRITLELMDAPPPSVPEPASLVLFGTALLGLGLVYRQRKTRSL